jgi:hypothetical protein
MSSRTAALLLTVLPGIMLGQPKGGTGTGRGVEPSFAAYPVAGVYKGPIAKARFEDASDERYLGPVLSQVAAEPNFAGQYRIVRFQLGGGPFGAVLVDSKSGAVSRLPAEVVQEGFFAQYDTSCLERSRTLQRPATDEEDDSAPLSFRLTSELLIVRRCIPFKELLIRVERVERSYYRWHGRRWRLVKRMRLPPLPPPPPVPD